MEEKGKKHRISTATIFFMITVALLYDGIQFAADWLHLIPVIGNISAIIVTALISLWAWLTFYVWFKLKGITFLNPKRALVLNGGFLIELIPVLNALPAWTAAVAILFLTTRAEELLEKAGPLGTVASKALAGKTQGALSLARSKKSEAEKAPE